MSTHTQYMFLWRTIDNYPLIINNYPPCLSYYNAPWSKLISILCYIVSKGYIGKKRVLNSHLGTNPDPCYIQNCVIMNRSGVIIIIIKILFQEGNTIITN